MTDKMTGAEAFECYKVVEELCGKLHRHFDALLIEDIRDNGAEILFEVIWDDKALARDVLSKEGKQVSDILQKVYTLMGELDQLAADIKNKEAARSEKQDSGVHRNQQRIPGNVGTGRSVSEESM